MILIILGIVLFMVSLSIMKSDSPFQKFGGTLRIVSFVAIVIGLLTACVKQIDAGYVGVKSLFGKVQNDVLRSGLNFVNPLVDVKQIDVRTLNYTMSGVHDEGIKSGDDAIRVLTADGLGSYH